MSMICREHRCGGGRHRPDLPVHRPADAGPARRFPCSRGQSCLLAGAMPSFMAYTVLNPGGGLRQGGGPLHRRTPSSSRFRPTESMRLMVDGAARAGGRGEEHRQHRLHHAPGAGRGRAPRHRHDSAAGLRLAMRWRWMSRLGKLLSPERRAAAAQVASERISRIALTSSAATACSRARSPDWKGEAAAQVLFLEVVRAPPKPRDPVDRRAVHQPARHS